MAIVKMNKIEIIALKSEREKLLDLLMEQGVTHIVDIVPQQIETEFLGLAHKEKDTGKIALLDTRQKTVRQAIDILAQYVSAKKVLFAPLRAVSRLDYENVTKQAERYMSFADEVIAKTRRLDELRAEKNHCQNSIAPLIKWQDLPFAFGFSGTKTTRFVAGTIPVSVDFSDVYTALEQNAASSVIFKVDTDKDFHYIYLLYHRSEQGAASDVLAGFGFVPVNQADKKLPKVLIKEYTKKIHDCDAEFEKTKDELRSMAKEKQKLEILYDYLGECKDKLAATGKLAATKSAVILRGWVPEEAAPAVKDLVEKKFSCAVTLAEPSEDEQYPIALHNARLIEPFETVTEMYSLPAPHSMDPTAIMSPFFFLFFGMMVSDAGYGLLLSLAAWFILWRYNPKGQTKKMMSMLLLGGISTIFWGIIFGGYFGDIYTVITGAPIPKLMDPMADPIGVLILSFILGLVHLFVAMGAQAYLMIRRGLIWDAVFDVGFWYLVIGGLGMLFLGGTIADIGKWMAIAGAIGLILTQGRDKKNIFQKLFSGIGSLYGISGYLSDLLSYSRLLALGLSTGVVAGVVNLMGSLGGFDILGTVLFIVVFIIGHLFNMAINVLGAYVHSSRLQYVEFFGKFYESGGEAYKPFRAKRKYIEVVKD